MAKGGARTRSGPPKDPRSGRSEQAGFKLTALPSEGYRGRVPGLNQFNPKPNARHRAMWDELWSTPQACVWARERFSWPMVARLVQLRWRAEDPECPATIYSEILKLETKLALNEEGMRFRGLAIAEDAVAGQAAKKTVAPTAKSTPTRRLRSV